VGTELRIPARTRRNGGPAAANLDLLRGGRQALLEAKEHTVDASDMTDEEIECVEQMAGMVDQWQEMIGDDGSLRIYVD
jgi:hypothetical protein